jgi:hypothetical protein
VSGSVTLDVGTAVRGEIEVETHDGDVELRLPSDIRATFSLSTFSGTIDSEIGPEPRKTGRFEPYTELRFSSGSEQFEVEIETFSGGIALRLR